MVMTNWVCLKCGVANPKTYFKCQICQQPKPIFWECTACKAKNPTASPKCSGCRRKRPAIFANAINMKGLENVKFSCEGNRSTTTLASTATTVTTQTTATMASLAPGGATSGASTISNIVGTSTSTGSTLSTNTQNMPGTANSTLSALSQHVSSYDIFLKLNKPSRTVKQITYVDNEDKFTAALNNCGKAKAPFADPHFHPGQKALYFNPKQAKQVRVFWLRYKDMRPPEYLDTSSPVSKLSWCMLRQPVASDITQGILGNCWFLSALAVLVDKPALLDRVLVTKELNPHGVYRVRLYRDGKLTSVILDDQLPCNNRRFLIYSCAKRKQLFVPIIEKAMAKMYGCYESLVSGQTTEGLSVLTGYPCRTIRTQNSLTQRNGIMAPDNRNDEVTFDHDTIWTLLLSYHTAGFLMGAGCGCFADSQIPAEEYEKKGLMAKHAYSIISVVNVGEDHRLLQLRNPWGRQVWTGDWTDDSLLWTPELREQLHPNKANEGVFWISFDDFRRYFEKVDVCKLRDSWHEYRYEGFFPCSCNDFRYMSVFEVHAEEASTELEFTLHQESRRSLTLHKTPLLPICTAVFQLKDLQRNIAGDLIDFSGYKVREFMGCDVMVNKGVYLVAVYAFNHWDNESAGETTKTGLKLRPRFVLSLHSSRFVNVTCYCPTPTIIGDTIIELTIARAIKKKHNDYVISYYLHEGWSGLVVVIENRHTDNHLEVIFDASESTNLHTTRGNLRTQDTIPPMSRQLINILSHLDPSTAYYLSYQMSYRMSSDSHSNHIPDLGQLMPLHSPRSFKQIRE